MLLPSQAELADGLLKAMHRIGGPASTEEQEAEVVRLLNIDEAAAAELHSGTRTVLNYRLAWARTYLKTVGFMQPLHRGVWELSEKGAACTSIAQLRKEMEIEFDDLDDLFDAESRVEGVDKGAPEEFGEYPIDSVLIRQETRTVYEIVRRIKDDAFIMDPDFQRDFIWKAEKQSKLIESMVMRIPLPVFYLAEREDGKTVVVDGLQRLTTFSRFINNDFPLRELDLAPALNGMRFNDLPRKLQNRIEDTQLILYLIDSKVPEQAKLDIFDRVNGGVPLTRQQMRNSIYCGPATRWLKGEVESKEFLEATGESLDSGTMRDRECVNRFCAFALLGENNYSRGDMDAFLAQALKVMNRSPKDKLEKLSERFRSSMRCNYEVFGVHSFRKHRSLNERRSVVNIALFDVFSVLFSRASEARVISNAELIRMQFLELMENEEFVESISIGTNSTRKVKTRFQLIGQKIGPIIDVKTITD